ncbi:hypothetical protein [Chryseobacterium nematophagum]|uniref:hypothetical protein n=1 Tax=Chryseobacterium nematophagum TaxID=2305228 RepID=UPI001E6565BD|nr:hypothetical protein [Chryseobacterium nematophagum]
MENNQLMTEPWAFDFDHTLTELSAADLDQHLTELLALDLGIHIFDRIPYANEIFKWQDMALLPHSSADTLLCEIFEWNGRNLRSTGNNLIGFLFSNDENDELNFIKNQLIHVEKHSALIPDFEFTKENMIDYGLSLPSLFNINLQGNINNAKNFSIRVNGLTKARITNIDSPGIEILKSYSSLTRSKSKTYRRNIKFNYLIKSLFYAESVEIYLEKESGADLNLSFQSQNIEIEAKADTDTKKHFILKYSGNQAPFAAQFVKGKDFDIM